MHDLNHRNNSLLTYFLATFFLLMSFNAYAVDCSQENITLQNQLAVDDFQATYGGGGTCDRVSGSLFIDGADINNLTGLSGLQSVGQTLSVQESPMLSSLAGLENLSTVSGLFQVFDNDGLNSLAGLDSLTHVSSLTITANDVLSSLDGLESLWNVNSNLHIQANPMLMNLDGISNVSQLSSLVISDSPHVTDLLALSNIPPTGVDVSIHSMHGLTSLAGIGHITTMGALSLFDLPGLINIDEFSNLQTLDELMISNMSNLLDINGLSSLTAIKDIELTGNSSMIDITGLSNISGVVWLIRFWNNDSLPDLNGLQGITRASAVQISGNTILSQIDGLSGLEFVLTSVDIDDNDSLVNIDGLSNLSEARFSISISSNDSLENLDGLIGLSDTRSIEILDNDALNSVTGLANLPTTRTIRISGNDSLESLNGLQSLVEVNGEFTITDNTSLADCSALQPVLDPYDDGEPGPGPLDPGIPDIRFEPSFSGNLPGCNSILEILEIELGAQCSTANLHLSTQDGVDEFQSIFGYGGSCTQVLGDLLIQGGAINDLSPLSNLQSIGGTLSIWMTALNSLTGLHNISDVYELYIGENTALSDSTGLEGLESANHVTFEENSGLTTLQGLHSLSTINGHFWLQYNPDLTGFTGLGSLQSINRFTVNDNPSLLQFNGLGALANIDFQVSIKRNNVLSNIDGLVGLTAINSLFELVSNPQLTSIQGLQNITFVPGDTTIRVIDNDALTSLHGLHNIVVANGTIAISDNGNLTDMSGLESLEHIGHTLAIVDNDSLTSLNGLGSLLRVGDFEIFDNDSLQTFEGLTSLFKVSRLKIRNNPLVESLEHLEGLSEIDIELELSSNLNLSSIQQLAGVDFDLFYLGIGNNPALVSLDGLQGLEYVWRDAFIHQNSSLSMCADIAMLIDNNDDGDAGPGPGTSGIPDVGSILHIADNAPGCNSVSEILFGSDPEILAIPTPSPLTLSTSGEGGPPVTGKVAISNVGAAGTTLTGQCALVNSDAALTVTNSSFEVPSGSPAHVVGISCDTTNIGSFTATLSCTHSGVNVASPLNIPISCTVNAEGESETGPEVPCTDCEARINKPLPTSGPWADTDLDGSGFLFRVQNDTIAGWYFGYSESGDSDWMLFNAQLQEGSGTDVLWRIEAPLLRFTGGSCPDCDYSPPSAPMEQGSIEIEFLQKNHARFRIDGGPDHYVVPLHFGAGGEATFEDQTPYILPNLAGPGHEPTPWVIVQTMADGEPSENLATKVFHLKKPEYSGFYPYRFESIERGQVPGDPAPPDLIVVCGEQDPPTGLHCKVSVLFAPGGREYEMPLGNLGHNRFFAEDDEGNSVEGFRINYD